MIVLTARGEVEDRVAGLDAGAVDYLVKPFSLAELAGAGARPAAHRGAGREREHHAAGGGHRGRPAQPQRCGAQGEPVLLSTTEFELLVYLLRHRGTVLSREQILSAVWGYEHDPATNIVDVYIGYLRRKLRRPDSPAPIHTVRSVGLPPRQPRG